MVKCVVNGIVPSFHIVDNFVPQIDTCKFGISNSTTSIIVGTTDKPSSISFSKI